MLDVEQADQTGAYIVRRFDDQYFEAAKRDGDEWKSEYIFKNVARDLAEFAEMCDFQQYSPESHFTKGKLCSIMTESGRKTLTDSKFVVTSNGERHEMDVSSEALFIEHLGEHFGITRA